MTPALGLFQPTPPGHADIARLGSLAIANTIDVMFPWWDIRPGLSPARPCRPADYHPVEVDDDTVSEIGTCLLAFYFQNCHHFGARFSAMARIAVLMSGSLA
jgi:hypothetical protein